MPTPLLPLRPFALLFAISTCGEVDLRCDPTPSLTVTPTVVDSGPDAPTYTGPIDDLVLGFEHGCALYDEDDARCWGGNAFGALSPTYDPLPGEGLSYEGWEGRAVLAAGGAHTCAAGFEGVFCWGRNDHGQVTGSAEAPGGVFAVPTGLPEEELTMGAFAAAGLRHSCAATATQISCWGDNSRGQLGPAPLQDMLVGPWEGPWEGAIEDLAAGAFHSCALAAGTVYCWGENSHGQLGPAPTETPTEMQAPRAVPLPARIVELAAGPGHTCARDDEGDVYCWGQGLHGELGQGTRQDSTEPVLVDLPFPAAQLFAGGGQGHVIDDETIGLADGAGRTCILDAEERLACWGANDRAQLDANRAPMDLLAPTALLPTFRFERLALGGDSTCAIDAVGLLCWGDGRAGQTGTDDVDAQGPVRTTVFRF